MNWVKKPEGGNLKADRDSKTTNCESASVAYHPFYSSLDCKEKTVAGDDEKNIGSCFNVSTKMNM